MGTLREIQRKVPTTIRWIIEVIKHQAKPREKPPLDSSAEGRGVGVGFGGKRSWRSPVLASWSSWGRSGSLELLIQEDRGKGRVQVHEGGREKKEALLPLYSMIFPPFDDRSRVEKN